MAILKVVRVSERQEWRHSYDSSQCSNDALYDDDDDITTSQPFELSTSIKWVSSKNSKNNFFW